MTNEAKNRFPLDHDGVLLVTGDQVIATALDRRGETGKVVGVKGLCILVKLDRSHVTLSTAAASWKKV